MTKEAMKLALEALKRGESQLRWEAVAAIEEALAQPEQEPVACVQDLDEVKRKHLVYEKGMDWKDPLYTTPPQRKPLTDEQIEPIAIDVLGYGALRKQDMELFTESVRAVEAAHGIKE